MPTKKTITLIGHTAKKSAILAQTVFTFYELGIVLYHHHHHRHQQLIRLLTCRLPTTLSVSSKSEHTQHIFSHLSRTDTCDNHEVMMDRLNPIFQNASGSWPTELSHFTIPAAVSWRWRLLPAKSLSRFAVVQRSVGPAAWRRSVPPVVRYYYYYYYYYY